MPAGIEIHPSSVVQLWELLDERYPRFVPWDPSDVDILVLLVVLLLGFVAIVAAFLGPWLWRENGWLNRHRRH
jgi:hypothetical protein